MWEKIYLFISRPLRDYKDNTIPDGLPVVVFSTKDTPKGRAVEQAVTKEEYDRRRELLPRYQVGKLIIAKEGSSSIKCGEISESGAVPEYSQMKPISLEEADYLYDHEVAEGTDILRGEYERVMARDKKYILDAKWAGEHQPRIEMDEKGNGIITFPLQGDQPENIVLSIEDRKIPLGNLKTSVFTDERRSGADDAYMTISFESAGGVSEQELSRVHGRNRWLDAFRACLKDDQYFQESPGKILDKAREWVESDARDMVADIPLIHIHYAYAFNPEGRNFLKNIRERIMAELDKQRNDRDSTPMHRNYLEILELFRKMTWNNPDDGKKAISKAEDEEKENRRALFVRAKTELGDKNTFRLLQYASSARDKKSVRRLALFDKAVSNDNDTLRPSKNHYPPELTFMVEHVKSYDEYKLSLPDWRVVRESFGREIAKEFGFDYLYENVDKTA